MFCLGHQNLTWGFFQLYILTGFLDLFWTEKRSFPENWKSIGNVEGTRNVSRQSLLYCFVALQDFVAGLIGHN